MGWLWLVILILLLLGLIVWWFSRRTTEPAELPPAAVTARDDSAADDLTRIEGIGPKVAQVLNGAGIRTFDALARANPAEVQSTLNAAGLQMMNPEGWIEQASLAAKGDWEALDRLQSELKGGRKR
jgi:predicted flap endonuclease-1-like 5' DNA nuclease